MSNQAKYQSFLDSTTLKQMLITLLLMIVVLFQTRSSAQVLYGSLTGNVTDPNGAAVVGAKVEARGVVTGVAKETTTDAYGIYRFVDVLPGSYSVTVSAPGFASRCMTTCWSLPMRCAGWTRLSSLARSAKP